MSRRQANLLILTESRQQSWAGLSHFCLTCHIAHCLLLIRAAAGHKIHPFSLREREGGRELKLTSYSEVSIIYNNVLRKFLLENIYGVLFGSDKFNFITLHQFANNFIHNKERI